MRIGWIAPAFVALGLLAGAAAANDEALRLRATVHGHRGRPADIEIAPDGVAAVRTSGWSETEPAVKVEVRMTARETDELRALVEASRFFDVWRDAEVRRSHAELWDVTIFLGAREMRRERICNQPQFEPVARFLRRFVAQAETVASVRRGGAVAVARDFERAEVRARVVRPEAVIEEFVPALVAAIASQARPDDAYEPARYLLRYAPAADWPKLAGEVLSKAEGERRDAVIVAWLTELKEPERAAKRAGFAPIALAEARAPWGQWENQPERRTNAWRGVLDFVLVERVAGAMDVAAEKVRAVSTIERAFVPRALAELGAEAVPLGVELLDDAAPSSRRAGATILESIATAARGLRRADARLSGEAAAAAIARLTADAFPALDRHAKDAAESLAVREECFRALAACEGRDLDAERRAANAAERERRAAESRAREEKRKAEDARRAEEAAAESARRQREAPPKGNLSIAGRVLAAGATPLAGFTVTASREDGTPANRHRVYGWARTAEDGSFRIDGLVEGAFSLVATGPGWSWRTMPKNSTLTDDVEAGETGVELRFVGAMLRGRITGPDGKPIADRDIGAHMRDAPSQLGDGTLQASAWGRTDREGRFLFLQLFEGVYDVEVPGVARLTGSAVSTGAQERAVGIASGATMSGRVVDTAGLPVARASVRVLADGRRPVATVNTDAEGRFRIPDLDPDVRYTVCSSYVDIAARTGERSSALIEAPGCARDFVLTIDTGPSLALRVEFGSRAARARPLVRLERLGDGDPQRREFNLEDVFWRAAPPGEWKVFAHVRDVDGSGRSVDAWLEIGTVTTGEPKRMLTVPD